MKRLILIAIMFLVSVTLFSQTIIIPPEFNAVRGFSEGLACVEKNGKWGFVNVAGDKVIPMCYLDARDFHEGKAAVKTEKGWGYIDKNNKLIIEDKYYDARDFGEGLATVRTVKAKDSYYHDGYEGEYWGHSYDSDDIDLWEFIREDGVIAFRGIYNGVSSFNEGVAAVFKEKYWSYIDKKGKLLFTTNYDNYYPLHFSNGMIPNVGGDMNDEWGYCDLSGKWLIQPQYRSVSEFHNGIAVVEEYGGQKYVIDTKGNTLYVGKTGNIAFYKSGYIIDGKDVYLTSDFSKPVCKPNISGSFWGRGDVVSVPSPSPAGSSVSVSDKSPINLEYVDVKYDLKPTYYDNPAAGLWATKFDNGGWGFTALSLEDFINSNVSERMEEWLKKGEYESTAAWNQRTSDSNRQQQMVRYANELLNNVLKKGYDNWVLSDYDADNECFALQTDFGQFPVEIPASQAKSFKANWKNTGKTVVFGYRNGLVLQSISFQQPNGFSLTQVVDQSDNNIRTKSLATLAWPDWDESIDKPDFDLKVGVKSDSKISRVEVSVNGVVNRGIKTVEKDRYDLVINRSLTLNEGANVIRVSVTNDVGTTQEEKTINYRPLGKDLPSIDWLDFASTASKQDYLLKLGIKSKSKIEDVSITINGALSRGVKTVKTDDYTMTVNRTITLSEGINRIVVSVRNAEGVSTSERVITYNGTTPQPVIKEKRIALVIGNSKYEGNVNSLTNPYNDATDIGQKLKKLGFETIVLYDGTKKEMNNTISSFVEKARNYDVALFYYAGHGLQLQTDIGGTNYLIPVDAQLVYKCDAEDCISANRIVAQLEASGCNIRLIILDACRDLPNLKECSRGSSNGGFSEISSSVGTYIMYSTREGKTAEDGKGHNSPFAEGILKYIEDTNVPVEEFFKKVGEWVDVKTGYKQSPWPSGRIRGNFYFNRQ